MKIKNIFKKPKKKIVILSIILAAVLVIIAVVLFLCLRSRENNDDFSFGKMPGGMQGGRGNFIVTEDMIAASGVTGVGMIEESFDVENLTTGLEIEEIYISSEESIEEGTKVLKLSEESVADAREELEQILKEADLAYRAGAIEYEQSKITAEYDRDSKLLEGKFAQAVYDETVASLEDSLERAREEVSGTKEQIAEYQSYVSNDTYREYFKVDEYQAVYDENLEVLMEKMEEWGVTWPQVTGQGGQSNQGSPSGSTNARDMEPSPSGGLVSDGDVSEGDASGGDVSGGDASGGDASDSDVSDESASGESVSGGNMSDGSTSDGNTNNKAETVIGPTSDQIQVLANLYDILEKNAEDLENVYNEYEDALANASLNLQSLQLNLPGLEEELAEAEKNYETRILQAKLTYETSLANAESAESDYETAIQKAESDYESLKEDWEDAKENLELFENTVGDGYFYASGSGTILRTMVRAGQYLSSEGVIFMYSNPEDMTVTVSVDQADIARIALGDSAYIQSSAYGGFKGTVIQINPVSGSSSRTGVTYDVTVQFSGDSSVLGANESVTVVFGAENIKRRESHEENF